MPFPWPLLMPVGSALVRLLPRPAARRVARVVGAGCYALQGARRRVVEGNLVRLAPGLTPAERRRLARATFVNFASVWVDTLRLPAMSRSEIIGLVEPESHRGFVAEMEALLAQGRGVVLVSLHLGAVDLAGAYLAAAGLPITTVAEDIAPRSFAVWRRYRSSPGLQLLSRRRGAVGVFRALARGRVAALLADRLIGGPGTAVAFGAGLRLIPTGPAAFALRSGAPLLVAALVQRGDGYRAIHERPVVHLDAGVEAVTRALAATMSRLAERHLDQWFVFQPGWLAGASSPPAAAPASSVA